MNKSIKINDLTIFYRESGVQNKETILFLHGNPTSSHMYKGLMSLLEDKYHVIAPDYPGYGFSDRPRVSEYEYSFDNISNTMNQFIDKLNLKNFYLFMQDYGGPIGFRIATRRPELINGLIIQNANAYTEGFGEWAIKIGEYIQNNNLEQLNAYKKHLVSLEGLKEQYVTGAKDVSLIDPSSYFLDYAFLQRPGVQELFLTLFDNYGTNFEKYEEWQHYLKTYQPPTLVVWGSNDKFFSKPGGEAYAKDLKDVEIHFFDGGHFMLEEYAKDVSVLIKNFIK
ncbi:alpha/beta fold hydrolase [Aquimarina algicola]|uniref:Alpha/beta hydrolase n=1 Tax=Aquimarina algicola TaxID=2589995 RepID=A0A504JGE4_9FLAO|nr:alpha/beta hydrolase [Aquimarina algicola]TPN87782.1 alpha/beta hydrolase [Aquimarina algicola]